MYFTMYVYSHCIIIAMLYNLLEIIYYDYKALSKVVHVKTCRMLHSLALNLRYKPYHSKSQYKNSALITASTSNTYTILHKKQTY